MKTKSFSCYHLFQNAVASTRKKGSTRRASPGVDEVDELHGEAVSVLVGAQLRGVPLHNLGQLLEDAVPLWVREPPRCHLYLHTNEGNVYVEEMTEERP